MSHPPDDQPPAPDRAARILVIDDEPLNVDVIGRVLREAGYDSVSSVTDPRRALAGCIELQPDLIMLDLHMPHLDGLTVLRQIRAQTPAGVFLPILVLTADWSPEARHRALASGASDFLTRPLDTSEIVLRVGNHLSTRALQAQLSRQNHDLESAVDERTAQLRTTHQRLELEMKQRIEAQEALRRHTDFVHLVEVITVAASQSAPVHQTMQVALDQICASTGWEVGHALKRTPSGTLASAGLWYLRDPARYAPFRKESDALTFASGVGLPGRVLASGQPAWIVDLATDINFRRGHIADQHGLRGGFALPLLVGNEVAAVLEFFSAGTIPPQPEMLDVMHHIGAQLGRVLERQRSEEALRSSEAKFRSFAHLASDGIVLADGHGGIISWNRGAQAIFGYAEEEAVGHSLLTLLPSRLRNEFRAAEALLAHPNLQRMLGRTIELEGCRKDGSTFPMELALDVWTTWDGTFCSGVVRDMTERKRLEESLRQGEDRLRRLLEATKVIPWTLDFDTLSVTWIGPQIVALLGFSMEAWHRPGFWQERLHPEDRDWTLRACEEALGRTESQEVEYRVLAADGRTVWIHSLVTAGQGSRTLSGFLLDVTPQKQAQETLREYAAVYQFSHEAIMGGTLEGTITSWNRGAERLSGYTSGEVLGRSAALLLPSENPEDLPRLLAGLARGEHVEGRDTRLRRKDGQLLDVCLTLSPIRDAHGRVSGVCGIARDISERKRAEETLRRSHDRLEVLVTERTAELQQTNDRLRQEIAERLTTEINLRQSEDRLKTLITSVEEIVFEFGEDGTYANFWAGDTELIAQINTEFAGRSFAEVFGESVGRTFQETVRRVLATGRPETVEHTLNLAGGRRWFLSRIAPLNDPRGERRTVCLLARDITHRKAAEEELRVAKDDAERANSAKTNFLSRMSHELRTPLNAILGFAQLLDRERLSKDDQEGLDQIQNAGQHLLGLINEVLDMARIEVGRLTLSLEPVSSAEAVAEAQALVRPMAAGRDITLEAVPGDWMIMADRQRLRQVLLNFLSNAIKYNRNGGTVTVTCAPQEGCLRLAVTDSGKGIPTDRMEHLFKPFERLETHPASVEGIGLGLAISKRLIELMGGSIGVESQPGEGSTFWLTLPRARQGAEEASRLLTDGSPPVEMCELPPCYILYIEDNLSNLKLVERILARQPGVHLLAATHGQPGLELALRHLPALILLDLHLPDLPGSEVLARLRADPRTEAIPVIVTSADAGAKRLPHLRNGAIQGFVSKPIDVEEFTRTLNGVLGPQALHA